MNQPFNAGRLVIFRRGKIIFALIVLLSAFLIYRLVDIQIIHYEDYRSSSNSQLTYEVEIGAKRGTIYDCNGKILAVSSTVERIFISPNTIPDMSVEEYIQNRVDNAPKDKKQSMEKALRAAFTNTSISLKEDIANELSTLLSVDKAGILQKMGKTHRADETVKRKVEQDEAAPVKDMVANKLYSRYVHFVEESKRYYPNGQLASHVIGFTNADGDGVMGVEAYYNQILEGIPGNKYYWYTFVRKSTVSY